MTRPRATQSAASAGRAFVPLPTMLALEMALHEEREGLALEGELEALKDRWREAEEIASIADVLPEDPLNRLTLPERT